MIWANFTDQLGLDSYQRLKKQADKTGQWSDWREKTLSHIRSHITKQDRKTNRWYWNPGYSLLVEIFLWEKEPEAAWKEALEGGCSQSLWMKLAALRAQDHPLDAVEVYMKYVNPTIEQTNNKAYEEAVQLIKKIQPLMFRQRKDEAFTAYVDELRTRYKAKRNFIKLLDKIQ